jgi:hypothetical protein
MSNAALLYIYHTLKMDIPPSLGYRTNVTFPKKNSISPTNISTSRLVNQQSTPLFAPHPAR